MSHVPFTSRSTGVLFWGAGYLVAAIAWGIALAAVWPQGAACTTTCGQRIEAGGDRDPAAGGRRPRRASSSPSGSGSRAGPPRRRGSRSSLLVAAGRLDGHRGHARSATGSNARPDGRPRDGALGLVVGARGADERAARRVGRRGAAATGVRSAPRAAGGVSSRSSRLTGPAAAERAHARLGAVPAPVRGWSCGAAARSRPRTPRTRSPAMTAAGSGTPRATCPRR